MPGIAQGARREDLIHKCTSCEQTGMAFLVMPDVGGFVLQTSMDCVK